MLLIRAKAVVIAVCVVLSLAARAQAWGPDGHRTVGEIAYQLLDAAHQSEIRRLTRAYRTPDGFAFSYFNDGCNFPDAARAKAVDNVPGWERFAPFEKWHFLNLPRTAALIEDSHCAGNCVLTGIAHHTDALTSAPDDQARAEALFFLCHWVGDVHQPLHVSYQDDLGGNQIKPILGDFAGSGQLHRVWDSGIIGKTVVTEGWRPHAQRLALRVTPAEAASWVRSPPLDWAQESYNLSTRPGARYCQWQDGASPATCAGMPGGRTLDQPYQDEFADDVDQRLQQAGARLADLLRRHLPVP